VKRLLLYGVLLLPVLFLFFPRIRRAIVRRSRALLLLWAGAVLVVGLFAGRTGDSFEGRSAATLAFSAIGLVVFVVSFLLVLLDSRSSSKDERSKKPR